MSRQPPAAEWPGTPAGEGTDMEMTSWDLAILAETEYRRERLAEVYRRGTPRPARVLSRWARDAARRLRDGRASRRYARATRVVRKDGGKDGGRPTPGQRAVQGFGSTLDAVAARTDPAAWERQVTRRTAEISEALAAMGPRATRADG